MNSFYETHDEGKFDYIDGSRQVHRLNRALLADSFLLDERSISDMLVYVESFSKYINYYNVSNKLDGDWQRFFQFDESFVLAKIASTKINHFVTSYDQLKRQLTHLNEPSERKAHYSNLYDLNIRLALTIDGWYQVLKGNISQANVRTEVENAIDHLAVSLNEMQSYKPDVMFGEKLLGADLTVHFDERWNLRTAAAPMIKSSSTSIKSQIDQALAIVDEVFKDFRKAAIYIIQIAQTQLEETLSKKNDHEPHIGLLLSFLKLIDLAKVETNTITKRHLDFYYSEVLRQRIREASPDHVHLFFELPESNEIFLLPAGTKLNAGKDIYDHDVFFETISDLWINKVAIADLKTTYVSSYPMIERSESEAYLIGNSIYSAPMANSKDGLGDPLDDNIDSWPAFGEDQFELAGDEQTMVDGEIGLFLSSPILLLPEGIRKICLTFDFEEPSFQSLRSYVAKFARLSKVTEELAFYKLMSKAFNIYYTHQEDWEKVDSYSIYPLWNEANRKAFRIEFILDGDEPSMDRYDAGVHRYNFEDDWPVILLELNNYATFNPYAALRNLVISVLTIDVDVQELKDMMVKSSNGQLDKENPFYPFGSIPTMGSYLSIGKPEVINKYLNELSLNIEWMDLPLHERGFEEFFEPYDLKVRNDDFKVSISALSGNSFQPEESIRQEFSLFRSKVPSGARRDLSVAKTTQIDHIDIKRLNIRNRPSLENLEQQYQQPQAGFIRLELTAPAAAFGHSLYPKVFPRVAMENATSKKDPAPLPDQPYAPIIKSLTLSYMASMSEELKAVAQREEQEQGLRLRHKFPFGIVDFYPNHTRSANTFLPEQKNEGSLMIGLKGLKAPQTITLFVRIKHNETLQTLQSPPEVQWSYLADNHWHALDAKRVISDTTDDFVKSGIIKIEIPKAINRNNTRLSSDLHWIKAGVTGMENVRGRIVAIHTNALSARRVTAHHDLLKEIMALPANAITDFVETIPQIAAIHQPYASFGGEQGENEEQYYIRVSERLNHKQRALTSLDYEKMVLQKFPDIMLAKCIGYINLKEQLFPGTNVQLVVIPEMHHFSQEQYEIPRVDYDTLSEIKSYLQKQVAPFVNVEVGNPVYEIVKVFCAVRFAEADNKGYLLQKLNYELRQYLSPWMFDEQKDLKIGGIVYKTEIQTFIESRDYVTYVTQFSVIHIHDLEQFEVDESLKALVDTASEKNKAGIIKASAPNAVLISAINHSIEVVDSESSKKPNLTSVGSMQIGEDFILVNNEISEVAEKPAFVREGAAARADEIDHNQDLEASNDEEEVITLIIKPDDTTS